MSELVQAERDPRSMICAMFRSEKTSVTIAIFHRRSVWSMEKDFFSFLNILADLRIVTCRQDKTRQNNRGGEIIRTLTSTDTWWISFGMLVKDKIYCLSCRVFQYRGKKVNKFDECFFSSVVFIHHQYKIQTKIYSNTILPVMHLRFWIITMH